ncbi:MAG: hypothetical protein ND866_00445 [Pyrinomonadaceae bacterium]|nr:hypothetical protein [Pyrinomonadaceae bacterium]
MNTRKRFVMTLALGVAIIGLAAAAMWHTAVPTQAQEEPPRERRVGRARASLYGLHELTRAQTARLSVVNAGLSGPGDERPQSVTLAFDIYEANPPEPVQAAGDGSVHTLRFLRRVSHTLLLRSGEAASLEFEASRAGETIAAWVLATPPEPIQPGEVNPPDIGRPAVVTSLEVRQGNRTQFVLPAVRQGFDPQPEPPVHR